MLTAQSIVEKLMPDLASKLVNEDSDVTSAMAETNACGYGLDGFDVDSAEFLEVNADEKDEDDEGVEECDGAPSSVISFSSTISLEGDSTDRPWCGDQFTVKLEGIVVYQSGAWKVQFYRITGLENNFHTQEGDEQ